MSNTLNRGDRETFAWPVSAKDSDGDAVTLTEVDVAFLRGGAATTDATTYYTAPVVDGKARLTLASHAAPGDIGIKLPAGRYVPLFRIVDGDEIVSRPGPRITVA